MKIFNLLFSNYSFAIQNIVIGVILQILGIFVYLYNKRSYVARIFALFCFVLSIWLYGFCLAFLSASEKESFFWSRILYVGVCFSSVVGAQFVRAFLGVKNKKWIIPLFYSISVAFLGLALFTTYFIDGVYRYNWGYYVKAGVIHPLFMVYIIFESIYSINLLYQRYKRRKQLSADESARLKYVFYAFTMGHIVLINFLPTYGVEVYPIAQLYAAILFVMIAYGIINYRLLDIQVIIKRTLIFTGLLVAVLAILILPTLFMQEYLARSIGFAGRVIGLTISGLVIILTVRRIENFLIDLTDKYLFQKKYDYKELLKTFSSEVLTVLDLKTLISLTSKKLCEIMRLESCKVALFEEERGDREALRGELIVPISLGGRISGALIFGKKKSDEPYAEDDKAILMPIARALAIAISNARLFEELKKTEADMAENEKMATVGTLAAGMAHEIRNPIATIKTFSEYLPEKMGDKTFLNKYRDIVVKQVDKINHIVQTMVDFSSDERPDEPESVSVYHAIDDMITLVGLGSDISGRIEIINNVPTNISHIKVNKKDLDEILLNITQNAIHAIEKKGKITFGAEEKESSVMIEISDTGCGMSEEVLKNIFSPFFTTRSKGFGLGLFVVSELVRRNGGKVLVESRTGQGTTFKVEFRKG